MHRPISPPDIIAPVADPSVLAVDYTEAGRRIGVSCSTIRRLVTANELRAVSLLGSKRIPVSELEAFLARKLEAANTAEAVGTA